MILVLSGSGNVKQIENTFLRKEVHLVFFYKASGIQFNEFENPFNPSMSFAPMLSRKSAQDSFHRSSF